MSFFDMTRPVKFLPNEMRSLFHRGFLRKTSVANFRQGNRCLTFAREDPDFSSAEIVDVFRLYETEDGLLIPGAILHNLENLLDENEKQPASPSHPAAHKTKRGVKALAQRPIRDLRKKDADDRQLKLFGDE